ncbi:ankyrin domain-containing protein [Thecamonas trahens ATCC 50062]|uniref:Ankyrin domain-containing protein n=1 Tax=Thecamonas trahens ATCC 50062 TaxID=461836 RepID=A0A0L0DV21_THETB|nr:ankyrin domain-containing protein [Thecamonas trahens ATCC 50062]KNC55378.1 ankyrin domain-containing protein [Thecamonas trahens ATCC 50062]|eukprot:XP_013753012.1 ankyrin domain-containing protein [Thecamonas trahens ATCC 50062]
MALAGIIDGATTTGRGVDDGWVKCPVCVAERDRRFAANQAARKLIVVPGPRPMWRKRFARGRGLRAHLETFHRPGQGHWASSTVDGQSGVDAALIEAEKEKIHAGIDRNGLVFDPHRGLHPGLLAAAAGDLSAVRTLIAQGWDWTTQGLDKHGSTAAEWAAGNGHVDVLDELINRGPGAIDTSALAARDTGGTRGGRTVLHWAARNGQTAVVSYLLADRFSGLLVDVPTGDGTTPLHLALYGAHFDAAQALLDAGADLARINDWGCAAAHWASMCTAKSVRATPPGASAAPADNDSDDGDLALACLQWVIDAAGSPHAAATLMTARQKTGRTPMHKAAQRGNTAACLFLLDSYGHKAVAGPDDQGNVPSDVAAEMGHPALAELLRSRHA